MARRGIAISHPPATPSVTPMSATWVPNSNGRTASISSGTPRPMPMPISRRWVSTIRGVTFNAAKAAPPPRYPLPWQPAARPVDRRPGQRTRPARARRAVFRARSPCHRPICPTCWPRSRLRARPCCSPAISSTWSKTCAKTWSSSTMAGSSEPAIWPRCALRSGNAGTFAPSDWADPRWKMALTRRTTRSGGEDGAS
jgi:hypothetical protein